MVDKVDINEPRTKLLIARLDALGAGRNVLILIEKYVAELCLAARNLPYVEVVDLREINPLSLIRFEKVVVTEQALKALEERLA